MRFLIAAYVALTLVQTARPAFGQEVKDVTTQDSVLSILRKADRNNWLTRVSFLHQPPAEGRVTWSDSVARIGTAEIHLSQVTGIDRKTYDNSGLVIGALSGAGLVSAYLFALWADDAANRKVTGVAPMASILAGAGVGALIGSRLHPRRENWASVWR